MFHAPIHRLCLGMVGLTMISSAATSLTAQSQLPPTNVTVAGAGTSVTVSWAAAAGKATATYRVLRALDARSTGVDLTRPLDVVSFVDAKVEPGITYFYQVIAVYADQTTGAAAPVAFTVPAGVAPSQIGPPITPARPASPATLTAVVTGIRTVDLTWPLVAGVSQYRVFGPAPLPATGAVVSAPPFRIVGVPVGIQQFTISAEYRGAANTSGLPQATVHVGVFGQLQSSVNVERTTTAVDITFNVSKDPVSFRLFRRVGNGGQPSEVLGTLAWDRTPRTGDDWVFLRIFPIDLLPDSEYRYDVHALMPNGDTYVSDYTAVRLPAFIVRATVPIAADRIVVEWNPFGSAPYKVKKGTMAIQGGASVLPFDFIRDAAGNPTIFTGGKFEDTVVQRGVKYYYMVCAAIPLGYACPGAEATIP